MIGLEFAGATVALIVERVTGYPNLAYRQMGHPVEWLGRLIASLENHLNAPDVAPNEGRLRGLLALLIVLAATLGAATGVTWTLRTLPLGWVFEGFLAIPFIAQKSLGEHVFAVIKALHHSLEQGRAAVAMIVGRDPAHLDESGVSRAALESLAENTSDGVVAPVFWFVLFGLPGIAVYKVINTTDSMIGHKSERYLHFGWAAARLDDIVNLPCSRLTGFLFAAAAATVSRRGGKEALSAMWRDAAKHVSPNAGWPEAALAGAMDIRLGGPRAYGGRTVDLATMGHGRADLNREDIRNGLKLFGRAMTLLAATCFGCAVLF
jgi:adenosylcobinamide-phosphate synthase